mmetsp:Transcript_11801/g.18289  ORF Transcript_11801/g.18289 Transcript_11801/m.18289 type:complete len:138 (+) Transcript_11801:219-632(+)
MTTSPLLFQHSLQQIAADDPNITKLCLDGYGIGDDGAEALAKVIQCNTHLQKLYLQQNQITPLGAAALAEALEENQTIDYIDLSYNKLGKSKGIDEFWDVLTNNKELKKFVMSSDKFVVCFKSKQLRRHHGGARAHY